MGEQIRAEVRLSVSSLPREHCVTDCSISGRRRRRLHQLLPPPPAQIPSVSPVPPCLRETALTVCRSTSCSIRPDLVAVWWHDALALRLSAFAAQTLIDAKAIKESSLELHRSKEYNTWQGSMDPVTGGGQSCSQMPPTPNIS